MAKRTLVAELARKPSEISTPEPLLPAEKPAKPVDTRVTTSLRMDPELMIALKSLAVRQRARVNDVIIAAITNHLALHGQVVAKAA